MLSIFLDQPVGYLSKNVMPRSVTTLTTGPLLGTALRVHSATGVRLERTGLGGLGGVCVGMGAEHIVFEGWVGAGPG